tara:strand:+ start:8 stop:331 length:324 start_codon:yes stop_codon:yes gene_type:complete
MKIEVKTLDSFPPNSNPFHHDMFHMGLEIGKDLLMMYQNHAHEDMRYMILVDTKTGDRLQINLLRDGEDAELERALGKAAFMERAHSILTEQRENEETNEDSEANGS